MTYGRSHQALRSPLLPQGYFLRNSIEFHYMWTECLRILSTDYLLHSLAITESSLYLIPNHFPIATRSHPNIYMVYPCYNHALLYPTVSDTLEWMNMQTGLPLSVLMKLYCRNYFLMELLYLYKTNNLKLLLSFSKHTN